MTPIEVSMNGASEAIEAIRQTIVPWRKKHAEQMAHLAEAEKQVELELKKAEILEMRAAAAKARAEANALAQESALKMAEVEKVRAENEKLRLEIGRERVKLAIEMIENIAPNLAQEEKLAYAIRLLPSLNTVIDSSLVAQETE